MHTNMSTYTNNDNTHRNSTSNINNNNVDFNYILTRAMSISMSITIIKSCNYDCGLVNNNDYVQIYYAADAGTSFYPAGDESSPAFTHFGGYLLG